MAVLDSIAAPEDVRALPRERLAELAAETRAEILATVGANGGHLASSLGAVELVIALLRVFRPPRDKILWDVGHQAYAWKILTGRREAFRTLRRHGGISGFPSPDESACDAFVAGHAGSAFPVAEGFAAARDRLPGAEAENVVAVLGDASLTNGASLEALNNCATLTRKFVLVVNDNEMSISRNVGAFARRLGRLLTGLRYNRVKAMAERAGHRLRLTFLRGLYHRVEQSVKAFILGNGFFESFGMRYIGPVDGHDVVAVEEALTVAKEDKRPVVVHVVTVKGRGFSPAERHPTRWHGVGPFDPSAPDAPAAVVPRSADWSAVFGAALAEAAARDERVCALTAAMKDGTGLAPFAARYPGRFFDSGICESHLVSFAAGLAARGLRPAVAVYSTFLQRAIDQIMHDVCLLKLPVVFAVDRAGAVGADGRTHHGLYDVAMLRCLPNLSLAQPADADGLRALLALAFARAEPTAIRFPRGLPPAGPVSPSPWEWGRAVSLVDPGAPLQLWALGDQVPKALAVARLLAARGVRAGVVDARFVKPFDTALLAEQRRSGACVASLENAAVAGGFGEAIGADAKFGWPDAFLAHGTMAELEADCRFDAASVAEALAARFGLGKGETHGN